MPVPSQTFATIQQLLAYINANLITNGMNDITGDEANSVLNSLANFIVSYGINTSKLNISSATSGIISLSKPVTVFTQVPTSIQWPDNVQNEYYIVNATGLNIPLSATFSYVDQYGVTQTAIPFRNAVHIAKAPNNIWYQINNLAGSSGGGGLPPLTGNEGRVLSNNGTSLFWDDIQLEITSADFEDDGISYYNTNLVINKFTLFWNDANRYIRNIPPNTTYPGTEWVYASQGGFQVLIPGFDSRVNDYFFVLTKRGLNS